MKSKFVAAVNCAISTVLVVVLLQVDGTAAAAEDKGARIRDNLYATKFVSPKEGWAVGAFGVIFHTVDGGGSWQPQVSRTTEPLFAVDFVDQRMGWIVGRSGLVLHTDNGGQSWTPQSSGTDKHLFGVDFVDANFGIAVGDWGAVLLTRDGGKTWQARSLSQDVILNDLQMVDVSHGWIVGEMGTLLKTEDGGESWVQRDIGVPKTLYGVQFTDAQHGWLVGLDGLIIDTEDGGQTWTVRHGSPEIGALEQVQFSQAVDNPSLYAVSITNNRGFIVGETGAIFTSRDGGRTWARQPEPEDWGLGWLRDISIVPGTHGMIVGADGRQVPIVNGEIETKGEERSATETSD